MGDAYKPVLFELITTSGIPLSPWAWHARMALAHKGVEAEVRQHGFADKEALKAAGGKAFPFMLEADGTGFDDSMKIVLRLEEKIPDPTLFPGGEAGLAAYYFMHRQTQLAIFPALARLLVPQIPSMLEGEDHDYFVTSREERFGKPLAELAKGWDDAIADLGNALDPFRRAMQGGGYVDGSAPAMGDYLLFGVLQWARVSSQKPVLPADDPVIGWLEGMLDLHGGLGRAAPARWG